MTLEEYVVGDLVEVEIFTGPPISSLTRKAIILRLDPKFDPIVMFDQEYRDQHSVSWSWKDCENTPFPIKIPPGFCKVTTINPENQNLCWYIIPGGSRINKKISGSISSTGILHCKKCTQPNPYASSNQPDGSFICYGCRTFS